MPTRVSESPSMQDRHALKKILRNGKGITAPQRVVLDAVIACLGSMINERPARETREYVELREYAARIVMPMRADAVVIVGELEKEELRDAISDTIGQTRLSALQPSSEAIFAIGIGGGSKSPFRVEVGRMEKLPDDKSERRRYIEALWSLNPRGSPLRDFEDARYALWNKPDPNSRLVYPALLTGREGRGSIHPLNVPEAMTSSPPLEWIVETVARAKTESQMKVPHHRDPVQQAAAALSFVDQEDRLRGFGMERVARMEGLPIAVGRSIDPDYLG